MSKSPVTVGVVIRTKDRPLLLERALQSVVSQEFEDWRAIIINDGGVEKVVDRAVSLVSPLVRDKISILHLDSSRGMEAASNLGISRLDAELIAIHDDDDSWEKGFLGATVSFLMNHPTYLGVVTQTTLVIEEIADSRVVEKSRRPFNPGMGSITLPLMFTDNQFPPISFVFRKNAWKSIGKFNESLAVKGDWEFNLRLLVAGNIGVVAESLANYHFRADRSGSLANSVFSAEWQHAVTHTEIVNSLIRASIEGGMLPGHLALSGSLALQNRIQVDDLQRSVARLEGDILDLKRLLLERTAKTGLEKLFSSNPLGVLRGFLRTIFFTREEYIAKNPDVGDSGVNPLAHYLRYGIFEGREF